MKDLKIKTCSYEAHGQILESIEFEMIKLAHALGQLVKAYVYYSV